MQLTNKHNLPQTQFYTYIHRRASDGSVFYVGKGVRGRAWDSYRRNKKWESIKNKHGLCVEICSQWSLESDALEHEKFLILCFRDMGCNLANFTDGGEGISGYKYTQDQLESISKRRTGRKHSEETKIKISLAQKGKPRKKASDETKIKMSLLRAGKKRPPMSEDAKRKLSENNGSKREEVRKKISASLKGKKTSDAQKLATSLAFKGKPKSEEQKKKMSDSMKLYYNEQRKANGIAKTISEGHKKALRLGYNKHFGLINEDNK